MGSALYSGKGVKGLSWWLMAAILRTLPAMASGEDAVFLDNGALRLGVDLESGGSVFYLSRSEPRRNVLNRFDRDRFVQQSYYGDSDGSFWGENRGVGIPCKAGIIAGSRPN